jgi:hypothetical protein
MRMKEEFVSSSLSENIENIEGWMKLRAARQLAEYIHELTAELTRMASESRCGALAALLQVVSLEAKKAAQEHGAEIVLNAERVGTIRASRETEHQATNEDPLGSRVEFVLKSYDGAIRTDPVASAEIRGARQLANYIHEMTAELTGMARESNCRTLASLLQAASLEAKKQSHEHGADFALNIASNKLDDGNDRNLNRPAAKKDAFAVGLESAIKEYGATLQITSPRDARAALLVHRANAYQARTASGHADNPEVAIADYTAALELLVSADDPPMWAMIQELRSYALGQQTRGDREDA